jgi:hypothetical protein
VTRDESLEAFRDNRLLREPITNKKMKIKKATDSNLSQMQRQQIF